MKRIKFKTIGAIVILLSSLLSGVVTVQADDILPDQQQVTNDNSELFNNNLITPVMNSKQQAVVNWAHNQLGKPYVWGAKGPDAFDCSGLVQYVYQHAVGMSLPAPTTNQERYGTNVSLNALQPGDLLFWGSRGATYHVAIYIGGGDFIQAPQPGDVVKVTNMKYFHPSFAKRVLPTSPDVLNKGSLDNFSISGDKLNVRGWSASSTSVGKQYTYLFAMDAKTNKEIKRWKVNRYDRPDVQKAYPNIPGSLHSGFSLNVEIPKELLGKSIKLKARYTSDIHGNNNTSDYDFDKILNIPNKISLGTLETFKTFNGKLGVRGWSLATDSTDKPYTYLFAMDAKTNKEITRWKINRTDRPDVQKAYPGMPNSLHSGFDLSTNMPYKLIGKSIKLKVRYTSDPKGNYNASDYDFGNVLNISNQNSKGYLDSFRQDRNMIYARGWNIGMFTQSMTNRYLFIMESGTNKELYRMKINSVERDDVAKRYGEFTNPAQSGFEARIPINASMKGKNVYLISRYTENARGDGTTVSDIWFKEQVIKIN